MSRKHNKVTRMGMIIASMLALLSLLAACGGAATPAAPAGGAAAPTTAPEAAAAEPTATIAVEGPTAVTVKPTGVPEVNCTGDQKVLVWMVRNGPVENPWEANIVRPAFAKAHPEICLKILSINQDDIAVKREAMIAAGEQLDVWSPNWGGNGFASDRARGLLEDLTPLIQRDNFDTSIFVQDVLKIYQSEGKTWALPFLTTGSYVYYNQKMFKDAGIPFPTTDWDDPAWTWQAFVDLGKKFTKNTDDINKAVYGIGPQIFNDNIEALPQIWGQDVWPAGSFDSGYAKDGINVTDEKSVAAFQAFHDLIYKDKVSPDPAASQALDQLGGAFASGRVAMQMSGGWGHWAWKALIDDPNGFCWGAAPVPSGAPGAKIRTVIFTDPWVITKGLKPEEQDMAWEFVKFLVSPEQAAAYTKATGTPPTQTALLDDYYKQFEKCSTVADTKKVFEGAFSHGRESSNHMMVQWDELHQIWVNSYTTINSDPNADIKGTLTTIQQQTNEALARLASEAGK